MPPAAAPLIVIDDFAGAAMAESLLDYAVAREPAFTASKVTLGPYAVIDRSLRTVMVDRDTAAIRPLIESQLRAAVDAAMPELGIVNIDAYHLELEINWAGDGGFFKPHTDTLSEEPVHQRILTMVHYFHRRPQAFGGGQLRVYGLGTRDGECLAQIEPVFDRAVVFPSWFSHEVLPVRSKSGLFADGRFAMSCWVRRS